MLKEAIEFLVSLKPPTSLTVDGFPYVTKDLARVEETRPKCLDVHDLQGLIDFLALPSVGDASPQAIVVVSPRMVDVVTAIRGRELNRDILARAQAGAWEHPFNRFMDQEHFTIWTLSGFVRSDPWAAVVNVSAAVTAQSTLNHTDDGISQSVSILDGIQRHSTREIPSPLMLAPYRTFTEIEQPESPFVFRMRKDKEDGIPVMGLFSVFDASWESKAVASIAAWLRERVTVPVLA